MKLYGFPRSPNTRKVQAVAAHIGVPMEFEFIDITRGKSRMPEFLAMNPNGKTPVLVDDDFRLWESNAIMQYVAERKKNDLWPDAARIRADITRWQCWQLSQWSEGCATLTWENLAKKLTGKGDPDPVVVARAEQAFHRDAKVLDAHLEKHPYLVNDRLTLADFSVAAPLASAERAKMPLASYENIQAWYARIAALPAWRETSPT